MHPRTRAACLLVASCVMWVVALLLLMANVSVDVKAHDMEPFSAGATVCSVAPWDAGLNHNNEAPGGEHSPAFGREVAAKCYASNLRRFRAALAAAGMALVLVGAGVGVAWSSRRRA